MQAQNQTFYKFSGKVAEKLDQYLYLQISNDKKIQVNLENLDINNELSENLLQSGSEIEILAEETDKNLFNLKLRSAHFRALLNFLITFSFNLKSKLFPIRFNNLAFTHDMNFIRF